MAAEAFKWLELTAKNPDLLHLEARNSVLPFRIVLIQQM